MGEIYSLIKDLEAADGPSAELDARVLRALGWQPNGPFGSEWHWCTPVGDCIAGALPEFTESLDWATRVIPDGWEIASVTRTAADFVVSLRCPGNISLGHVFRSQHHSEPIARLIAGLKAVVSW